MKACTNGTPMHIYFSKYLHLKLLFCWIVNMFLYLQEMLQKYKPQIQDVDDVKCSYIEGDDNSFLPVSI